MGRSTGRFQLFGRLPVAPFHATETVCRRPVEGVHPQGGVEHVDGLVPGTAERIAKLSRSIPAPLAKVTRQVGGTGGADARIRPHGSGAVAPEIAQGNDLPSPAT